MSAAEIKALRALYREPDDAQVATLAAQCPDLGECIATQLVELSRNPSRDRCDRVLQSLQGVIQHVRRLSAAQEVANGGA